MNEDQPSTDPQTAAPPPAGDTSIPSLPPEKAPESEPPAPPPAAPVDPEAPYGYKADGTPRKSVAGPGRPRKRPADPDPVSVTPNPRPRKPVAPIVAPAAVVVDYDALGKMAANAWFGAGVVVFGREWEPNTEQGEHVAVKDAFRDYFKSKNITQIDPGVQLAIVLGSYSLVRVQRPTIKERLGKAWTWMKSRIRREHS